MDTIIDFFVRKFLRKIIPNGWGTFIFGGLAALLNFVQYAQGNLLPDICSNYGLLCDPKITNILTTIAGILIILLRYDTKTEIFKSK